MSSSLLRSLKGSTSPFRSSSLKKTETLGALSLPEAAAAFVVLQVLLAPLEAAQTKLERDVANATGFVRLNPETFNPLVLIILLSLSLSLSLSLYWMFLLTDACYA